MIFQCETCPNMTRPQGTKTGDYDFPTKARVGSLCKTCYAHRPSPGFRHTHAHNLAGLMSYLARRHERENAMFRREFTATYPHLAREQATA